MITILRSFLLLQLFSIRYVYSIMSLNCLQTLNTSDCNETPTRVFSYYKPGSRCELEVWRGCPTGNKFDTEEECSETCIYKTVEFENKVRHQKSAKCIIPEDLNKCNEKVTHGFKYDSILIDCVEVDTNCPGNIFEEKLECIQSCIRELTWDEKMILITVQQSKELDSILQSFSNSTTDEESPEIQTTYSDNLKTSNTPVFHSGELIPATDVEGKKLKGEDSNTTKLYENNESTSNSMSANNETATAGAEGTGVTTDSNAISKNNTESAKETTNQNIVTTVGNTGTGA